MGDMTFLKYVVCAKNKWNPFAEDVLKIPDYYWIISYRFDEMFDYYKWSQELKPQAELIGSISNPESYSHYYKMRDLEERGGDAVSTDGSGTVGLGQSDVVFDATKGLVDSEGNVVIDLKKLQKSNPDMKDMFVSY